MEVLEGATRSALVVHVCANAAQFSATLTALPRDRTRVLRFSGADPKPRQVSGAEASPEPEAEHFDEVGARASENS